jgi:hypothetical protein
VTFTKIIALKRYTEELLQNWTAKTACTEKSSKISVNSRLCLQNLSEVGHIQPAGGESEIPAACQVFVIRDDQQQEKQVRAKFAPEVGAR